jgi:hypothetical protein
VKESSMVVTGCQISTPGFPLAAKSVNIFN